MRHKPPQVREVWLLNPEADGRDLRLDTEAWFSWLEAAQTRSFAYPVFDPAQGCIVGLMTVRKERRQRGKWYWSVYRRQGKRHHRVYLGLSREVTEARLWRIAHHLLAEAVKEREQPE